MPGEFESVRPREHWQDWASIKENQHRGPHRPDAGEQQRDLPPEHAAVEHRLNRSCPMSMLARKRAAILTRADAIAEDPDKASVRDCLIHFPLEWAQIQDNLPLEQWAVRPGAARLEPAPAAYRKAPYGTGVTRGLHGCEPAPETRCAIATDYQLW
jgi:hypothetical protein